VTVNLYLDDPLVQNLFRQCEEAGLPLILHIAPQVGGYYGLVDDLHLPRLEETLKRFPKLPVIGHSQPFWAEIGVDVTVETRNRYPQGPVVPGRVPELFDRYPNLYGDLSAHSGLNAFTRDPEFGYRFLEEHQDRLLFGTDTMSLRPEPPQIEYLQSAVQQGNISREAFEKVTWRNAVRLLRLGIG
jgi:predicted TIM-barrel fold metal-dependent hydrolase